MQCCRVLRELQLPRHQANASCPVPVALVSMDDDSEGSLAQDSASEFEYEDQDSDVEIGSNGEDPGDQMVIEPPEVRKAPYAIMTRTELKQRQNRCISDAAELFDVNREESFVLLCCHNWDLSRLQEAWFADDRKVRERCGLSTSDMDAVSASCSSSTCCSLRNEGPGRCVICYQDKALLSLGCRHGFCQDCWRQYLHVQVDDGKSAILTRCPAHKCGRRVTAEVFHALCDDARKDKYDEWYLRTYVDDNPSVKWCLNPEGCSNVIEYHGSDPHEITCSCTYIWCWACGEEAHRPADCKTVNMWNVKNSAESENISWIRANTKKCPKCHKPIEKNQGCNHMVCAKAGGCGHEFCWLCLGDWSTHGTTTGGYYQCNIYDKQAKEGKHSEEEQNRARDKHALDKYMHFFERFMEHDKGMKICKQEEVLIEEKVQKLHDNHEFAIIELQFLYDALKQVRACRRVLKWTYVYGYYLDEAGPEKNLFEFLQKNLEEKTDLLHEMLEKDVDKTFFDQEEGEAALTNEQAKSKFMDFRSKMTNFTNVTQKFREQILADLGVGGRGSLIVQTPVGDGVSDSKSSDLKPVLPVGAAPSRPRLSQR